MNTKRFLIAALALTCLAGNAWADTDKLTTADGWTKITTVPTASDIANNYYVFVDATHDLMLGIGKGEHNTTKWYSLALYYRTSVSPTSKDITPMVWTLESNDGGFSMRNLDQPEHVFQTENNAAWYYDTNDVTSSNSWSKVNLALSDGKFTLENGKYTGNYIGPWTDNNFTNGAECAANKTTALRGYFYIYSISRAQFKQNLLDNASSSNPVDLTPWYVNNPTFDNGVGSEWESTFTANSLSWWGSHAFSNTGAENYQQVANFYQDLTLPNGKYKVAMQGATSKPEENEPYVYGIHNGTKTKTYFTQSTQTTPDGNKWNDMQYTLLQMMSNRTWGQVMTDEITVTTGSLTIGYANEGGWSWDVFDNFKLYCTGVDLSAYETQLSDLVDECNDFISSGVVPDACETAISSAITTYNKSYETAKEYSTAIVALTAVLNTYKNDTELQTAYAAYKTMRTNVQELENTTLYKYTDPGSAKTTFDAAISSANTAVEAATTASAINTQTANIRAAALTFVSSVTAEDGNPFNLTFLASTAAADWQTASGLNAAETAPSWSVPKPDPSMADFVESYTQAAGGESITGNILYQTLSGMPAGYYTVALYAAASYTPNRGSLEEKCTDGQPNITFGFAGDNSLSLPVVHRTSLTAADQVPVNLSVQQASSGGLTFGIKKTAAGSNWHVAQIYTITYSKDPDLTILKADRDALVSEANGLLASDDANLLTPDQQNALSSAISTAEAANTFDELTEVTLNTLPNAIQAAKQQIQLVKANRVEMIAALERFENDYNLADGTDYGRLTMSADAWETLIGKVNAVTTALDDVSQVSSYSTVKNELVAQMDATDASLRLFKSYKAMVEGTTALSIIDGTTYAASSYMDTDTKENEAITALNNAFGTYANSQIDAFSVAGFLGSNLDFSTVPSSGAYVVNSASPNVLDLTGWEEYAVVGDGSVNYRIQINTSSSETTPQENTLYIRANWGDYKPTLQAFKQKMLPVGKYTLTFKAKEKEGRTYRGTNLNYYQLGNNKEYFETSGTDWETITKTIEVTSNPTPFDLSFGFAWSGSGGQPYEILVDDVTLTYFRDAIELANDANNATIISENNGKTVNATLKDRTLFKNRTWNTLCLPFNMTSEQVTAQLAPTSLMELDVEGKYDAEGHKDDNGSYQTGLNGTTLYLYFKTANAITAGKPYLIKWNSGDNFVNPTFRAVTVTFSDGDPTGIQSKNGSVTFQGTYSPVSLVKDDPSNLYMGSDSKLYWPVSEGFKVNAFRAYFQLSNPSPVKAFVLGFDDSDPTTEIIDVAADSSLSEWHTLDGRRLGAKPTQRGIYINNGRKVIVK